MNSAVEKSFLCKSSRFITCSKCLTIAFGSFPKTFQRFRTMYLSLAYKCTIKLLPLTAGQTVSTGVAGKHRGSNLQSASSSVTRGLVRDECSDPELRRWGFCNGGHICDVWITRPGRWSPKPTTLINDRRQRDVKDGEICVPFNSFLSEKPHSSLITPIFMFAIYWRYWSHTTVQLMRR